MLTQIKFTKLGCCSAIGNFEPGDVARIESAMAKHLVEEADVATYVVAKAVEAKVVEEPTQKRKGNRS